MLSQDGGSFTTGCRISEKGMLVESLDTFRHIRFVGSWTICRNADCTAYRLIGDVSPGMIISQIVADAMAFALDGEPSRIIQTHPLWWVHNLID